MSKKFGELVKKYRGNKSLKKLSDEIGISVAYLSDIENGNRLHALVTVCFDEGDDILVQLFDGEIGTQFWVKAKQIVQQVKEQPKTQSINTKGTVGQTKKFKTTTEVYQSSSMIGTKYTYKANTTVQILENTFSTIDKVKVVQTGRIGYVRTSVYK